MPLDQYRMSPSFTTVDYRNYINKPKEAMIKTATNERQDGRKADHHRPVVMKVGVLNQAKGSAYVEYNRTKIICSVFDPREIPKKSEYSMNGELYCEFKFAPFSTVKRRGFVRDAEEKEFSVYLQRALEPAVMRHQFPNFQVDIYVLVLENDGSCLAAAITCANLALCNAGVPMHDLVTAVSLGLCNEYELLDPTFTEEQCCTSKLSLAVSEQSRGIITATYMKTFQQVTQICQTGVILSKHLKKYLDKLTIENEKIYELCRQCLVKHILNYIEEKNT